MSQPVKVEKKLTITWKKFL